MIRIITSIPALNAGIKMVGEGTLDHRHDVRTGDKIEAVAETFNTMAERTLKPI